MANTNDSTCYAYIRDGIARTGWSADGEILLEARGALSEHVRLAAAAAALAWNKEHLPRPRIEWVPAVAKVTREAYQGPVGESHLVPLICALLHGAHLPSGQSQPHGAYLPLREVDEMPAGIVVFDGWRYRAFGYTQAARPNGNGQSRRPVELAYSSATLEQMSIQARWEYAKRSAMEFETLHAFQDRMERGEYHPWRYGAR